MECQIGTCVMFSSGFGINTSSLTERFLEHCVACIVIEKSNFLLPP